MKKITFKVCFVLMCVLATSSFAQQTWRNTPLSEKEKSDFIQRNIPLNAKVFSVNMEELKSQLALAPKSGEYAGDSNTIIALPNSNGDMIRYRVEEASVFAPEMQDRYPEIRAYAGYGVDDRASYLRFTVSPYNGVNGIVLTGNRSNSVVIEAVPGNTSKAAFFKRSQRTRSARNPFECTTEDELTIDMGKVVTEEQVSRAADDATLRTFDLAMSVTPEYSAFHSPTHNLAEVNAAIATTVARNNAVYEIDFAIRFVLIANNDNVVYLGNAPSDPYGPTDANYNSELQTELTGTIGEANYDVGHLMAGVGNNGNAGCIGCICVNGQKGSGYTTSTSPVGDTFDIDYVAHELGHQFGGRHTFTHASEGPGIAQMEPGSGSTIMGYAGITGATDVQSNSDPYFHAISIQQITTHAKSRGCDVETATGNTNPVITPGADLTLPIGTAFRLTGSATDANGDALTYCWEQYDEDDASNAYPDPTSTSNNRPLFRSRNPNTTGIRTFPLMADLVANGVNGNTWEKVPTVGRSADFRLTVRDNRAGGAANVFDDIVVTWDASRGPLEVTSQNSGALWSSGTTETVTWNVNSTNLMAGASNVDILLSTDGGVTFPTVLASNVANDGSEMVTVPNTPAPYCRVMVQPTGAPFFAINTMDFPIDYSVVTNCTQYDSGAINLVIPDDGAQPGLGTVVTNVINIADTDVITDVNIGVNITHTYTNDLLFAVNHPDATQVFLWNQNCGADADIDALFDTDGAGPVCGSPTTGTIVAPLSDFDGKTLNGDWTFLIGDAWGMADTGQVNSWYVESCTTTETLLSVKDNDFATFGVYPNPSNGKVTVNLSTSADVQMSLHDIRGRQVYSALHANTSNTFNKKVDFSFVSSGVYLLQVESDGSKATKKLVIQ